MTKFNWQEASYWANNGRYQALVEVLQKLIPSSGPMVPKEGNQALERLRKGINCYYDLYNNGGCNRRAEIRRLAGVGSTDFDLCAQELEPVMDRLILAAAAEQLAKRILS
jgi:hypothetical protein